MKRLSLLIKPASGRCNISCQYCFYADITSERQVPDYGYMSLKTAEKVIDNVFQNLDDGDTVEFAFQGGEPTLMGLSFYEEFVNMVKKKNRDKVQVDYSMQTNGILLDSQWCKFFKIYDFLIGLSLDGPKEFHDQYRLNFKKEGTYNKVMEAKVLLEEYKVSYNILTVLTNQIAKHPDKLWDFIQKENLRFVQFIPCIDEIHAETPSFFALEPEKFAYFYKKLFPLWEKEWNRGNYYSIGFFDNVISLLGRGHIGSCGLIGQCSPQYVVEANGHVYPCDFYVLDEYFSGDLTQTTLKEIFYSDAMNRFLTPRKNISSYCEKCPYIQMCNGGCKRLYHTMYLNKEEDYCGYQDFLNSQQDGIGHVIRGLQG